MVGIPAYDGAFPLGLLPVRRFETNSAKCEAGDLFAILGDGIVEVEDANGNEFGLERVEDIERQKGLGALSDIHDAVMAGVASFGKQEDDQTLLLMRIV